VARITDNKATEDTAVAHVQDRECRIGRHPHDVRHEGAAGDVDSLLRLIEVKAFSRSTRGSPCGSSPASSIRHGTARFVPRLDRARRPRRPGALHAQGDQRERLQRLLTWVEERHYFERPSQLLTTPPSAGSRQAMATHTATWPLARSAVTECRQ
jgi:hypothetical protein